MLRNSLTSHREKNKLWGEAERRKKPTKQESFYKRLVIGGILRK